MDKRLRRHRRVSVDIWNGPGEPRLRDISVSGLRAQSEKQLRIDERIALELPVPGQMLRLKGRVVRARRTGLKEHPYEYGVELDSLRPEEHDLVLQFIAERGEGDEPVSTIDEAELDLMVDRIRELEREVATLRYDTVEIEPTSEDPSVLRADTGAITDVEDMPTDVTAIAELERKDKTSYDLGRFSRLVALNQPMRPLVAEPVTELNETIHQLVARTFSDCFDLSTLKEKLPATLTQETIVDSLFHCYELDLIDFA
jgi:hypothetical protein